MSENTCASGLLAGRAHCVRESDWQANSPSGLSRSPYMRTHETCGVPGTPVGSGTRLAQDELASRMTVRTKNERIRMCHSCKDGDISTFLKSLDSSSRMH